MEAQNQELRRRLRELAAQRQRFDYRRLRALLAREEIRANHKRVHRIYREESLALRRRRSKKWVRRGSKPAVLPSRQNERWSMDVVSDCLATGFVKRIWPILISDLAPYRLVAPDAALSVSVKASPLVRVHNEGSGPLIADALHVRSGARYDSSPAPLVAVESMDGIMLAHTAQKLR